jgi:hypothetical protein
MRQNRSGSVGQRLVALLLGLLILTSCATVDPSIIPLPLAATGGTITGLVLDGINPITGATVSTIPPTGTGATDQNGRYTITGVSPQTLTVVVEPAGFLSASKVVTVLPGQTVTADLRPAQDASGTIDGRITDGFNAIPDAEITTLPPTQRITSSLDGAFLFTNLAPGQYRVDATKPGFFPTSELVTITPGEIKRVRLAATRRFDGVIAGIVTDGVAPLGNATAPVKITLFLADGRREIIFRPEFVPAPPPQPSFPLPLNFNYFFQGLPGGTAVVQAELPGFVPGIKEVRIEPPLVANGEIILSADGVTGAIAGTVFSPLNDPVPNVQVDVGPPSQPATATTTTDAAGRYRFPALNPGQYEVTAISAVFGTVVLPVAVGAARTADGSVRFP